MVHHYKHNLSIHRAYVDILRTPSGKGYRVEDSTVMFEVFPSKENGSIPY